MAGDSGEILPDGFAADAVDDSHSKPAASSPTSWCMERIPFAHGILGQDEHDAQIDIVGEVNLAKLYWQKVSQTV
jgi:hypothetical protein